MTEGVNILIVDDDPLIHTTLGMILKGKGLGSTLHALSGLEAIEIFTRRSERINTVLMDYWMAGMNGVETAERIRSLSPEVPILFLSGDPSIRDRLPEAFQDSFLSKPVASQQLIRTIRSRTRPDERGVSIRPEDDGP